MRVHGALAARIYVPRTQSCLIAVLALGVALVAAGPAAASPGPEARSDELAPLLRSSKLVFGAPRRVRFKLRCPTHESFGCRGTISIKTVRRIPVRILRQARFSAGPDAKAVRIVLVRKMPFKLKGASTRTVSTRLKDKFLRILTRTGRTRVDVIVVGRDIAGNVATSVRRVVLEPPRLG